MPARLFAIASLLLPLLLAPPVAMAEHDIDWQGWILELEGAYVSPGNTDTPLLANVNAPIAPGGPPGLFPPGRNDIDELEWDQDVALSGAIGYSFGKIGRVRVSYWTYTDEFEEEGSGQTEFYGTPVAYNWWTVGPIDTFATAFQYPQEFLFEGEMKASQLDLEYLRATRMGKPLTVTFALGARFAEFEETIEGTYLVDTGALNPFRFPAVRTVDNQGWGATAAVGAGYEFNEIVGLTTNLRFGFMVVDLVMRHEIEDKDGFLSFGRFTERVERDDETGTTLEFDFGVLFHIGGSIDLDVGWNYVSWWGLPKVDLNQVNNTVPLNGVGSGGTGFEEQVRDQVTWFGPQLRLLFHF